MAFLPARKAWIPPPTCQDHPGAHGARLRAEDMDKILGGNFLRVFAKVQKFSRQLQSENRPGITEQPFDKIVTLSNSAAVY